MPLPLQSKMLHVLQSGEFSPLGSDQDFKTDVWVIAATNQCLEDNIKNKTFREDLFYRLNIIKIEIPPLRERPDDIPALIEYFSKKYMSEYPRPRPKGLTAKPWPACAVITGPGMSASCRTV